VVTNIRLYDEIPSIFPMITICNLNIFTTNFSKDILNGLDEYGNVSDSVKLNQTSGRYKALIRALNSNESYQKMLGNSLNEIIVSCIFDWHDCSLIDDFSYDYDYEYGNCFRYNSGKNMNNQPVPFKSSTTSGLSNGLQLELITQSANENDNPFSIYNGFNIFISNRSVHSYYTEGINVSPGFTTKIIVNKYSILKKQKPYSQCTGELNSIYSQYYDLFLKEKMLTKCDCPLECDMTSYILTTSIAEYPTKSYANNLLNESKIISRFTKSKDKITHDDLKSRLISVNIFYNDLNHLVISEEVKMSIISLISYIGGTLSLFLGMSFLSFIEFVEIFLQTLYILLNKL